MIEKVEWEGKVFALIMRAGYETDGVSFVTSGDNPLQLGILRHRPGSRIKTHIHRDFPRTIDRVQEVLHIESGKVEVEFYNEAGEKVADSVLNCGDTILLLSGGHGFNILEETKIIEVKQGPYYGVEKDKEIWT